jgi:hypothetical protein
MSGSIGILVVLAIATIAVLAVWLGRKRRKTLEEWAVSKGLSFSHRRDSGLDDRYRAFGCLRRGYSRYAYNVATGAWADRRVITFDYHYAIGSGKSRHDYRFSAILLSSDVRLKPLRIRPEGLFDKVTEFFGLNDIDFESAEFSRAFHVKAPEERWAYDVLHQRTMEFLLGMPRLSIQFDEDYVLVWKNRRFSPEQFEEAILIAEGLLDRLPPYLMEQQKGRVNA